MYRLVTPRRQASCVCEINAKQLKSMGIKGIILDLDNTIIPWNNPKIPQEVSAWIREVLNEGFKIVLLSNNGTARVAVIAGLFSISYVANACKPKKSGFRRAISLMSLAPKEVAVIGDQLFTDILGGNRLGLYTIWVKPIAAKEFIGTKITRKIEKITVRILKSKGLLD